MSTDRQANTQRVSSPPPQTYETPSEIPDHLFLETPVYPMGSLQISPEMDPADPNCDDNDGCETMLLRDVDASERGPLSMGFDSEGTSVEVEALPTSTDSMKPPSRACAGDEGAPLKSGTTAYFHRRWLASRGARMMRIMSEFMHTGDLLKENDVLGSVMFIGSARIKSQQQIEKARAEYEALLPTSTRPSEITALRKKLDNLRKVEQLAPLYDKISDLAELLANWSTTRECERAVLQSLSKMPALASYGSPMNLPTRADWETRPGLVISTGGGPGAMEAANRGAARVRFGRSMGLACELPFECGANPWVDDDLNFTYHYFFTRKFWMVYMAMAVVACPGGFGTLDELMELLTLKQTGRFKVKIPIVLFGVEHWRKTLNVNYLEEAGMIDEDDAASLFYTDSPREAFEFIRDTLLDKPMYEGSSKTRR